MNKSPNKTKPKNQIAEGGMDRQESGERSSEQAGTLPFELEGLQIKLTEVKSGRSPVRK